ncbi:MAG: LytTR family transcriptional regulator [Roseburia sp.]|nr:LytTR family transcriptional regulator [Roseburia sp.]MCM1243580.1 LytTR family transcriptional regulator [Roseburia sp.]
MQIEIKVDDSYVEPKIIIMTAAVTEEIRHIMKKLSEDAPQIISGIKDDKVEVLELTDLVRIYANTGKVYAVTTKGEYTLRRRLYELEERLDVKSFVRISNSEIINLKKVDHFDLSFTGTICVKMTNGDVTYVSRRYVSRNKKILGI